MWKEWIRAAQGRFERGGAQRKRGGAPRTATDHVQTIRNNSIEFERPLLRRTFAFLRAVSALSAIKIF
jgi:hypothetical protein